MSAIVVEFRRPEGDIGLLTVRRQNAWAEFQAASRDFVRARERMYSAHNRWLDLDLKVYATNAAEKL